MSVLEDEKYMRRCLQLAELGRLHAAPNPMVGSVIVHKGKVIGEGFHRKCGQAHAEVNAINAVRDKSLLPESTIYVSLEPCAHVGRTPACSRLIIEMKIPRVVVGCSDSFDKVNGKGIQMLKSAGVDVRVGILEEESRALNKRFFTFHEKKRPYIILKWAQTQDGFIDFIRKPDAPVGPNWITDEKSRMLVHKWRAEEASIMVGTNTAQKDNPSLTVRDWNGSHPVRVVLDKSLRLDASLALFDASVKTVVFTEKKSASSENLQFIQIKFDENLLQSIFKHLFDLEIQSLIVEGGTRLLQTFIDAGLWDEARVFVGDKHFVTGVAAPLLSSEPVSCSRSESATLFVYEN